MTSLKIAELRKESEKIETELFNLLNKEYWSRGLINTRYEVVEFAIGYYGNITQTILHAITNLYLDDFIKA